FSSRRRHTRSLRDWSSDVCSSDLQNLIIAYSPIGVGHIDFAKHVLQRFIAVRTGAHTLEKQTAQAKTATDARCRPALRTADRLQIGRASVGKECRYRGWRYH